MVVLEKGKKAKKMVKQFGQDWKKVKNRPELFGLVIETEVRSG